MTWDELAGQWRQTKGTLRAKWAKLTDDDIEAIGGRKDLLVGRLQQRYGFHRQETEREVDEFLARL